MAVLLSRAKFCRLGKMNKTLQRFHASKSESNVKSRRQVALDADAALESHFLNGPSSLRIGPILALSQTACLVSDVSLIVSPHQFFL